MSSLGDEVHDEGESMARLGMDLSVAGLPVTPFRAA
jgi:hypothetical protein